MTSDSMSYPVFSTGILHILTVRPDEEMLRVDAGRVVATMANSFPFWDGEFIVNLPTDVCDSIWFVVDSDGSIAIIYFSEWPLDTRIGLDRNHS